MATPISISEARNLPGLRLLLLPGVPSPWSQAAKGIFEIKKIPYLRVHQMPGDPHDLLLKWTGQDSFPVAAWEQEKPRSGWAEILFLAERIEPEPSLVPASQADRSLFFGLAHELCGEMGLGWCLRLGMVHEGLKADPESAFLQSFGRKYGYFAPECGEQASARCVSVLNHLDELLALRREAGESFFFENRLTALDIYWATFSVLVELLPAAQCPISDSLRPMFTMKDKDTRTAFTPALRDHRDFVFQEFLGLPMEL